MKTHLAIKINMPDYYHSETPNKLYEYGIKTKKKRVISFLDFNLLVFGFEFTKLSTS